MRPMPARTHKKPSNLNTNVKASAAAGEVSNKVVDKKTKVNPDQIRVSKARKSKEVAKAKLSTRRDKEKIEKSEKEVKKAGEVAPAPKKIFNDELGDYGLEYEAQAIVDSKVKKGHRFYLVKWVGWPESANTWEPEANLHNSTKLITKFDIKHPKKP